MDNMMCLIDNYGIKNWYNKKNDIYYNKDLICIEQANGNKRWYKSTHHRENDLPAIEYADGVKMVNKWPVSSPWWIACWRTF